MRSTRPFRSIRSTGSSRSLRIPATKCPLPQITQQHLAIESLLVRHRYFYPPHRAQIHRSELCDIPTKIRPALSCLNSSRTLKTHSASASRTVCNVPRSFLFSDFLVHCNLVRYPLRYPLDQQPELLLSSDRHHQRDPFLFFANILK